MTPTRACLILAALFGGFVAAPRTGHAGDAPEKSALCSACHGENGVPVDPNIPVIWGRTKATSISNCATSSSATARAT